jgi:hypothetical protein
VVSYVDMFSACVKLVISGEGEGTLIIAMGGMTGLYNSTMRACKYSILHITTVSVIYSALAVERAIMVCFHALHATGELCSKTV